MLEMGVGMLQTKIMNFPEVRIWKREGEVIKN